MPIAILGSKGSRWIQAVAARCRRECALLDLDEALRGSVLYIDDGRVAWDGTDLGALDALLVERPLFAWPQPGLGERGLSPRAEREARALVVSCLHALARSVRVLDPPEASHLAVAPLAALDRCEHAGLRVHPWSLVCARPAGGERIWLDPAGSDLDLDLERRAPAVGEPAWSPETEHAGARLEGPVYSVLTIGGTLIGARRHSAPESWASGEHDSLLAPAEIPAAAAEAACAAEQALGLAWLQTDLLAADSAPRILRVLPGVVLGDWETDSRGRASAAMAALLEGSQRGSHPQPDGTITGPRFDSLCGGGRPSPGPAAAAPSSPPDGRRGACGAELPLPRSGARRAEPRE